MKNLLRLTGKIILVFAFVLGVSFLLFLCAVVLLGGVKG